MTSSNEPQQAMTSERLQETPSERIVRQWKEGPLGAMPPNILLETAQRLQAEVERRNRSENAIANFPTVMDILDAALTGDVEKTRSYAGLLADRYETQGRPCWADRVRRRLAPDYDTGPTYYLADAPPKQGEA